MPLDFTDRAIIKALVGFKIKNDVPMDVFIEEVIKIWQQEEVLKKNTTEKK